MNKPVIVFRVDASHEMGTGHVMRCLSLAIALKEKGARIYFITRLFNGNYVDVINDMGFKTLTLEMPCYDSPAPTMLAESVHGPWLKTTQLQDSIETQKVLRDMGIRPNLMIVDHYAIDAKWEHEINPFVDKLMVIDDLSDRPHECDYLLDQTPGKTDSNYRSLVPKDCKLFLGLDYALLRSEFALSNCFSRSDYNKESQYPIRIMVSLGGCDPDNITLRVLQALEEMDGDIEIDVVLGLHAVHKVKIEEFLNTMHVPTRLHINIAAKKLVEIMCACSLAIGTPGTASWERCCTGLPSILIIVADNQKLISNQLRKHHAAEILGWHTEVSKESIQTAVSALLEDPSRLAKMAEAALSMCDGRGVSRVSEALI